MNPRLLYVMGPSGAGKDSVLSWLRDHLPTALDMHWARRTITRGAGAGGEVHEAVPASEFERLCREGGFAMHWRANGLGYGIRHSELAGLSRGGWVWVNGSREYFSAAQALYPGLTGLHITASASTLERRLLARGREAEAEVRDRVARATAFVPPGGVVEVRNEGDLADAGRQVLQVVCRLAGVPVPGPVRPDGDGPER